MKLQDFTPYEQELLGHLAHIEELTTQQIISIVKSIMTSVGTGHPIDSVNDFYRHFYEELDKRLINEGKKNPNQFPDLWEFHQYWKAHDMSTYASRRAYVAGLYRDTNQNNDSSEPFWKLLHPDIASIARGRFDSGHYADAVEATLKEINSRMKIFVKQKTGNEYDGATLMNHAFSLKAPILTLDDLSTEDGKNIQSGYMQIFAGAMIGIRNPKAHSNIVLAPEEAIDLLFLASLLLKKFETASKRQLHTPPELSAEKRIYIRVEDASSTDTLLKMKKIIDANQGSVEAIIVLGPEPSKQIIRLPNRVEGTPDIIAKLETVVGKGKVKLH